MSMILYNKQPFNVVLHDPQQNRIILHNEETNQFQLVQLNRDVAITDDRDAGSQAHFHSSGGYSRFNFNKKSTAEVLCPNCGFDLSDTKDQHEKEKNGFPFNFNDNFYIHHDYFRLLSDFHTGADEYSTFNSAQGSGYSPASNSYNHLPESIFTQGYFNKFFNRIGVLGSGASGKVYKVEHVLQECFLGVYALKKMPIGDNLEYLQKALMEVTILYNLQHPNLISYNHVWIEMGSLVDDEDSKSGGVRIAIDSSAIDSSSISIPYVFILQQYCGGGNLEELIKSKFNPLSAQEEKLRRRRLREMTKEGKKEIIEPSKKRMISWLHPIVIWKLFYDIVQGVDYLHKHHILHRDLKPSNCLLDHQYEESTQFIISPKLTQSEFESSTANLPSILVSDFGEGQFEGSSRTGKGNTGTLEYTAPELLVFDPSNGKFREFSRKSDIYSLGMILAWLCFGNLPFNRINPVHEGDVLGMKERILSYDLKNNLTNWFIENNQSYEIPMPDSFMELISKLCDIDSTKRPSTKQILKDLNLIKFEEFIVDSPPFSSAFDYNQKVVDDRINEIPSQSSFTIGIESNPELDLQPTLSIESNDSGNSILSLVYIDGIRRYASKNFEPNSMLNISVKAVCWSMDIMLLYKLSSYIYGSYHLVSQELQLKIIGVIIFLLGLSTNSGWKVTIITTILITFYAMFLMVITA